MARSRLTNTSQDLIADGGAVLWSFVKGEQLEFPITLNFVEDASVKANNNYVYEAVVVEAANVARQVDRPTDIRENGIQTRLFVRLPVYLGAWQGAVAYNKEDVVLYNNKYYKLVQGSARINNTIPSTDPLWTETSLNTVYLQYPSTLASTWAVQPVVDAPVYGFFELRVTEPQDQIFTRTFKPIRGMVEILFSPTDVTQDQLNQTT
jgi:hypothetical protein